MSPNEQAPPMWVLSLIEGIRREMSTQHQQLRDEMAAGFTALRAEMQAQAGRAGAELQATTGLVRSNEQRLTKIETERAIEDKATLRRGSLAGVLVAALVTFALQVVKSWIDR